MKYRFLSASLTVVAAAALLGACSPRQEAAVDQSAARTEQKAGEMAADVKSGAAKVGNKVDDAMITAGVKTELAKDTNLSALAINVDTAGGKVTMSGSAPTEAAREQATMLAKTVSGVVSVDNKLTVNTVK